MTAHESLEAFVTDPTYVLGLFVTAALGMFLHWETRGRREWARDEPVSVEASSIAPYRGATDHREYRRVVPNPRAPRTVRIVAALASMTAATLMALGTWLSWLAAGIVTTRFGLVCTLLVTSFAFGYPGFRFAGWARALLHARPSTLRGFGAWRGLVAPLVALPLGVLCNIIGVPPLAGPALIVAGMLPLLALVSRRCAREQIVELWTGRGYAPNALADMEPPMHSMAHGRVAEDEARARLVVASPSRSRCGTDAVKDPPAQQRGA